MSYIPLLKRVARNMPLLATALVILGLAAIGVARAYLSRTSGFMTQDEALYFMSVLLSLDSGRFISTYGGRILFQLLLLGFSHVFGIRDGFSFLTWGPILPVFFSSITIVLLHRTLKEAGLKESAVALSILSAPLFFIFPLTTGFILSEAPALTMTMLGIYLALLSQRRNTVLLTILSLASFGLATAFRETFALYGFLAMLVPLKIIYKKWRIMSYLLVALMILLTELVLLPRIPASVKPSLQLLTVTLQTYAIGVGYGWSPPFAFLALSGIAALGFFTSRRVAADRAGLYQALFLCGLLSQITLFIEYLINFEAGLLGSQFISAFIRYSFAALPGAFLSISYGCMGLEKAIGYLVLRVTGSLKIVHPRRFWAVFMIFIVVSVLWNVYEGPTALAYSQSALTEVSMVASGKYAPVASGSPNQSSYPISTSDPFARLRTGYKSQPIRLYDYVNDYTKKNPSSKILVVIGDVWIHSVRARVLLHGVDNVQIVEPPEDQYSLCALASSYDLVLLYGEYYGTYYTQTAATLPSYYLQILANQTDIKVLKIYEWQEGYLYRLEKYGNSTAVSADADQPKGYKLMVGENTFVIICKSATRTTSTAWHYCLKNDELTPSGFEAS